MRPVEPRLAVIVAVVATIVACGGPPPREPLPGAEPMPPATVAAIQASSQSRAGGDEIRTRHLRADGSPKYSNRLLLESSPYLRQHAHNPVDWYPWGDQAFDAARRLGRPLLLSVGYSTCHWCHVMEEESFEDEEIARFLNRHYVAIKVDREQRPDLDSIYMTAVQAMGLQGGWPMTVWLTPAREPFFAGTYFPARDGDRGIATGFVTVLAKMSQAYRDDPQGIAADAATLAARVREVLSAVPAAGSVDLQALAASAFDVARTQSALALDRTWGGTRSQRKFPSALSLRALLRLNRHSREQAIAEIVALTLDKMATGGIHDHLGGGFHRYSVDPQWLVPHFEKMLYDNALLTLAYLEAWQATGRAEFADVARGILFWVRTEMTSPDAGFYSATDADSRAPDGRSSEGRFFTWTAAETAAVLGDEAARRFNQAYAVTDSGSLDGRSVLHRSGESAWVGGPPAASDFLVGLDHSRLLLLDARSRRPRPLRDEKILTAWNGLMISAAAQASIALGDDGARRLAARAADYVLGDWASSQRLAHSITGGRREGDAFLDDYAFVEAGLLDLFEAGDGARRLAQAIELDAAVERDFEDPAGGWFLTPADRSGLLVRERVLADSVVPSGASVAAMNLLRLAELTGNDSYRQRAERALSRLSPLITARPLSFGDALLAVDFAADTPKEIVLVSKGDPGSLEPFLARLGSTFVPNRIVVRVTAAAPSALPIAERKTAIGGRPTAYVCENHVCEIPTHDPELFAVQLRRARPLLAAAAAPGSQSAGTASP